MNLAAGIRVGPYDILAPLGAGGMGEVYRARDDRLARDVALKILSTDLPATGELLRRFEQEARAASALNHPNIITIYDIGRVEGAAYIAMELIEGRDLRSLMAGEALPLKQALRIAVKVSDGLAAAHERGIVHRDLKPENIMLSRDGFVKILDFGLAKLVRPFDEKDRTLPHTTPGAVFGTVGYMSPEQAAAHDVDYRSDQFALGVILYEMLTGRLPFSEPTAAETLAAIIRTEPRPITNYTEKVPPELLRVVRRLLAKDPEERYASTRDLARDLREVRDRNSNSSETRHSSQGPHSVAHRRQIRWIGAAAGAAAIIVATSLMLLRDRQPPEIPQETQPVTPAELSNLADRTAYAEAVGLLQHSQDEVSVDRAIEILERLLRNARESAPLNAQLARALHNKSMLSRQPGLKERAMIYAERAVKIDPSLPEGRIRFGQVLAAVGRFDESEHQLRTVLTSSSDHPDATLALARTYELGGRAGDAERMYEKAIALRPRHANGFNQYAAFLYNNARYQAAESNFRRFTELLPTARGFNNLGEALQALGRYEEAEAAHRRALALEETTDGYTGLGQVYYFTGRFSEAYGAQQKATAIAPSNYIAWLYFGDACRWAPERRKEATPAYERTVATANDEITVNPKDPVAHAFRAIALAKLGRSAEAEAASKAALDVDPGNMIGRYAAAVVALLRGAPDVAVTWLDGAVKAGYPPSYLHRDPEFKALRDDAGFRRALEGPTNH